MRLQNSCLHTCVIYRSRKHLLQHNRKKLLKRGVLSCSSRERKCGRILRINHMQKNEINTYPVESINCHSFKGPSHHGVLFQDLVEVVHWEGVQATVCVCSYTGSSTALRQKADLWGEKNSAHTENKKVTQPCETLKLEIDSGLTSHNLVLSSNFSVSAYIRLQGQFWR